MAWSGRVEAFSKGERLESAVLRRQQSRVLAFARKGDRPVSAGTGLRFGEVDESMIAESTRSLLERAKEAKAVAASKAATDTARAELVVAEPAQTLPAKNMPVEQTAMATTTPAPPSLASPPPPVKLAPKSWAALLRPSVSASTKASDAVRPTLSGSVEYATEAQSESESAGKAGATGDSGKPAKPVGYAAVAAAGSAAWGASRSGELDLGKLLSEGVGGLPLSAGAAGLASIPRGLINTGNMCFANSVSRSSRLIVVVLTDSVRAKRLCKYSLTAIPSTSSYNN
jgi:hypothetical protein